jgi:hypothetical protein
MTRNGKIARLPRNIRDELNHRLQDGEPGGRILEWLNALPPVSAVLAAEFGGDAVNAQNLSNWRKGGYSDWLKRQERHHLVHELTESADELATAAGGVEISNHLSAVLVAELAGSARAALATITDPSEKCAQQQEILQLLARVRRQDYLAGKLAIEREIHARDRARERQQAEDVASCRRRNATLSHFMKWSSIVESFARPDLLSQGVGLSRAESLLWHVKLDSPDPSVPSRPTHPDQGESR